MLPGVVAHADWSTAPGKRWMVMASLNADVYRVGTPEAVSAPNSLAESCVRKSHGRPAVIGFDFPIGLPAAYAERAGIVSFREVFPEFGTGRWQRFHDLAERPEEIALERPFYPARPGGTKQAHLVEGLGVASMDDLLRECERGTASRNKACALFWTLGGNQVGRAAIAGWRHALVPAAQRLQSEVALWPFEGDLGELLTSRACVLAETYPADACVQLGLPAPGRGWSKRDQAGRREQGMKLLDRARDKPIDLSAIQPDVEHGFGSGKTGEDAFDAWVGLLGMLAVLLGDQGEGGPQVERTRAVEGWILGQETRMDRFAQ